MHALCWDIPKLHGTKDIMVLFGSSLTLLIHLWHKDISEMTHQEEREKVYSASWCKSASAQCVIFI